MTTDELIREAAILLLKWKLAPLQRPGEHVMDDSRRNREIAECVRDAKTMIPALVSALKAERAKVKTLVEALRPIVDAHHMGRAGDTALSIAREALAAIGEKP